ncbi:MAG: tol-pal system protein YbgF [Acidobacteria bacterium]|nr:tol-pal system protein YbgF [Acidobacteriota bacterium]
MRKIILLLLFTLPGSILLQGGTKEELIRLQSDIVAAQNQIRLLQKSIDENGAITKTLLHQLLDLLNQNNRQIDQIRSYQDEQLQSGNENIEDIVNEIRMLSAKVDELGLKLTTLARTVEDTKQSLEEMQSRRPTPEKAPDGSLMPLPPDQLYSLAYNDYIMGNYELSIQGFLDYLALYKDTEFADNAQYYIGDSYFNQGRYPDAVEAFAQVTSLFPNGDKAPAAVLKSGLAYLNMSNNDSAIELFRQVIRTYPDSPEANIAKQQLQILGVE